MEDKPISKEEVKAPEPSLLEKTTLIVERQEKANAELRELLEKRDKQIAQDLLGGTAEAGQKEPVKPETSNVDYAKQVLAGDHNDNKPAEPKKE